MNTLIGEILGKMREQRQVTSKQLCNGICNASAYSNYEWRDRVPDFLTLNYILERLGHGITGMTAYLGREEMEYIRWRNEAGEVLQKKEWEKIREIRKREPEGSNAFNENIKKQYSLFLQAVEKEEVEKNPEEAFSLYKEIISLTCSFLPEENLEDYCLGKTELFYYAHYLRSLAGIQPLKQEEVGERLEKVIYYVEKNITEEEERVNIYPYEASPVTWMFTMAGEYLRSVRIKQGLTQERLSEGVCAVETYSRIEQGKRLPNRNNYKKLSEKLGIKPRYMVELLDTKSYQAICLRKEIDEAVFYHKDEEAKKLLKILEEVLEETGEREKNRQYLEARYLDCEKTAKGKEISIERIEKIINYTLSLEEIGKGMHCYTRVEINLIHTLVTEYQKRKDYEKAVKLLKHLLQDLEKGTEDIEERFRETYLAALNLDKVLTDMGYFEEGNRYCMRWGKMAVKRGWATLLDDYLIEISYNLENMGGYSGEYTRQLGETVLQISETYGTKRVQEDIRNYLKATYGEGEG